MSGIPSLAILPRELHIDPHRVCAAASCTQSSEQTPGTAELKLFTFADHQHKHFFPNLDIFSFPGTDNLLSELQ